MYCFNYKVVKQHYRFFYVRAVSKFGHFLYRKLIWMQNNFSTK